MATSPHFDDHLLIEPGKPLGVSGKEAQSILESANSAVKELGDVKAPYDGILEAWPRKKDQEPVPVRCLRWADNGELMGDKVPMLDKTGAVGTQVADQTTGLNDKSGDDDKPDVDGFIKFRDCVGRRFRFPYKEVKKWKVSLIFFIFFIYLFFPKTLTPELPSTYLWDYILYTKSLLHTSTSFSSK
jgi:hypothetical protein